MAKKVRDSKRASMQKSKAMRNLALLPFGALLAKILIILNIEGYNWYAAANGNFAAGMTNLLDGKYIPQYAWYGADGENYLRGVEALAKDGLFSEAGILSYWPAGYPFLLWLVGLIFGGWFFAIVAILQSALYAFACWLIAVEMKLGRLAKFAIPFLLILTLNPTLTLNTIAIGYELPTASLLLIALALMLRYFRNGRNRLVARESIFAALALMLATLMQPRLFAFAAVIFLLWGVAKFGKRSAALFLALSLAIVAIAPALMVFRNVNSNGMVTISTNLGTTMNIGAGPKSTGGYTNQATGVECPEVQGTTAEIDSARVRCVIGWYLNNPTKAISLFWNKTIYFWSPWVGPAANGTMARNPWRINHPINETVKTEEGFNLVYGNVGKLISWSWMLVTFALMILGLKSLYSAGYLERLLGVTCFSIVIVNWLITILTIGDHRFRIPSMGASLLLQTVGLVTLFVKNRDRYRGTPVEVNWAGIHWNRRKEADNLPPQNG
jgi:hypothetical protein